MISFLSSTIPCPCRLLFLGRNFNCTSFLASRVSFCWYLDEIFLAAGGCQLISVLSVLFFLPVFWIPVRDTYRAFGFVSLGLCTLAQSDVELVQWLAYPGGNRHHSSRFFTSESSAETAASTDIYFFRLRGCVVNYSSCHSLAGRTPQMHLSDQRFF
jgi:hypothetical protein